MPGNLGLKPEVLVSESGLSLLGYWLQCVLRPHNPLGAEENRDVHSLD